MRKESPFFSELLLCFIVLLLIINKANTEVIVNEEKKIKNHKNKRPSYLVLNKNNILTPNYSKEVNCLGPPIFFFDVNNRSINSLKVDCIDTFLLINNNGELIVRLTDETYYVNDRKAKKQMFFDYNLEPTTFILRKYNYLSEIEDKSDSLLETNFDAIPIDYNTTKDGEYINWIVKTELLGVNTISNKLINLPSYNFDQTENKFEINIPVKEKLFLIFIIKTNIVGIQNTYFAAFPIFFLTNVIYDYRKPLLKFHFDFTNSNNTEIYDIKRGFHHYKGLKLKINKIHGERILFSNSLFELEKEIKERFDKLIIELDSKHNIGIVNALS